MSDIVDRLNRAIMQGPIETPAWIINTMLAAVDHIAKLEAALVNIHKDYLLNPATSNQAQRMANIAAEAINKQEAGE